MASIRKSLVVTAEPGMVWAAIRDVGAIHERLARGFVTATSLEDDARVVTFANGMTVRERIVTVDDEARRLVIPEDEPMAPAPPRTEGGVWSNLLDELRRRTERR